jgi:hypothetical protein
MIELSFGGSFNEVDLVEHIKANNEDNYIIQGQQNDTWDSLSKFKTLDAWIRQLECTDKNRKQADSKVMHQLTATGLFEEADELLCPESGHKCKGLVLTGKAQDL